MSNPDDNLRSLLRELLQRHAPASDGASIDALVARLLDGERARLGPDAVSISFGDLAQLTNSTVAIGDVTYQLTLPAAPDPLQAALLQFAALPLATLPPVATAELAAVSRLPLRRQPTFVGRSADLQRCAALLDSNPVVVTGMLGAGKTSLALEFAHRYGRYFAGGVFWIDCAETSQIADSIAQCGEPQHLALFNPQAELALAERVQRVQRAWREPVPRLLVFDNCEDPALVAQYAPIGGGARMLITARHTQWPGWPVMTLEGLPRPEGMQLLQQLAPQLEAAEAAAIAERLGDLPLALHLAGSYLGRYHLAGAAYLAQLAHSDPLAHGSLAGRGITLAAFELPGRSTISLLDVLTLACDKVPAGLATQLLDVLSQFAPSTLIAEELVLQCLPADTAREDALDALHAIRSLGLLEAPDAQHVRLQHLVHALLGAWYGAPATQERVSTLVSMRLIALYTSSYPFAAEPAMAHAAHVAARALELEHHEGTILANNLAQVYEQQGRYAEAAALLERALTLREAAPDQDAAAVARLFNNLGDVYHSQGQLTEAETAYQRALALSEAALGAEALQTTIALNNLAGLYSDQERHADAADMFQRVLGMLQDALGDADPSVAVALNNLAGVRLQQEQYAEAEALSTQAANIQIAALGEAHPDLAPTLNNLAMACRAQQRYAEAEELYHLALELTEQAFGAAHPSTAIRQHNLAYLYAIQGRFADAEPLLEQAAATALTTLGAEHPTTQTIQHNLAQVREQRALASDS